MGLTRENLGAKCMSNLYGQFHNPLPKGDGKNDPFIPFSLVEGFLGHHGGNENGLHFNDVQDLAQKKDLKDITGKQTTPDQGSQA